MFYISSIIPYNNYMKTFLFKLLGIQKLVDQAYIKGQKDERTFQQDRERQRNKINFPVGELVIIIGNSPPKNGRQEPLTATVVDYMPCGNSDVPVLEDSSGNQFTTMGKMMLFDQNRFDTLKKLPWWEQWNAVSQWGPSLDAQSALNLENNRPAWDNGEKHGA